MTADDLGRAAAEAVRPNGRAAPPPSAEDGSSSLELYRNSVTKGVIRDHLGYEIVKCRCDCWFCSDCSLVKGLVLRADLVPILDTFSGLLMVSLTVDPELFPSPRDAYLYMTKRRCVGRLMQALRRGEWLHSSRYFYVLEWQERTEQAHFHVLLDSSFVPFEGLLGAWSKNRPRWAGPVMGDRPPFGTAWISQPRFSGGPLHAARYATKYLIKPPAGGFPEWVLGMGKDHRIRRYSTSRPFWGRPAVIREEPKRRRAVQGRTYAERIAGCAQTVNMLSVTEAIDTETGEFSEERTWVGELRVPVASLEGLPPRDPDKPGRRFVEADSLRQAVATIEDACGHPVEWGRYVAYSRGVA